MRSAPIQMTAALDRLMSRLTIGKIDDISRPALRATVGDAVVGVLEALGLLRLADERPHHPDAGDLLAEHPVDLVDALLHHLEGGDHEGDDDAEHQRGGGDGDGEDRRRGRRPPAPPGRCRRRW